MIFRKIFSVIGALFLSMSSVHCEDGTPVSKDGKEEPQMKNSLAVVLYDEENASAPLARFHKQKSEFTFTGRQISIRQNWSNLGVAGVVWDAAVVLCEYIEKNPELVKDRKVIELGAGTGLVGIVAALLGADITITDRADALRHLSNVVASNVPQEISHKVRVETLDWTESLQKYAKPFDVILGADVIYIEETFPHLLKTLLHLSDGETSVFLSCRIRYERDTNFLKLLAENFTVTLLFTDEERDVRIYSAKKKS